MAAPSPVLVLGSTGLLGQALLRLAGRQGRTVVGVARHAAVGQRSLDLGQAHAVTALLDELRPRLVINAAALTDLRRCEAEPGEAWAVNTRLPGLLAAWCARHGTPLVHVSTDHYYRGAGPVLHGETEPVDLVNDYARQKYAAEALVATCPGALVLRTNIVGWRGWPGRPSFAEWALAALRSGQPFDAYDDMWTSSLDADHFAAVLFEFANRGTTGLLNVAARTASSKRDFITALARTCGLDPQLARPASVRQLAGPPRANALGLDVSRAEALLGRPLPDLAAVVRHLAHTLREPCHAP